MLHHSTRDNRNIYSTWAGGQPNRDIIIKYGETADDSSAKENKAPPVTDKNVVAPKSSNSLHFSSREESASKHKKKSKRCYVPLNEKAKPIGVRVGRGGELLEMKHCVKGKFKLDFDEPIVLLGDCPDKIMAERFLAGFGRFVL